jgi:RNA polymerase sigma-70 factor, ECF subfamily
MRAGPSSSQKWRSESGGLTSIPFTLAVGQAIASCRLPSRHNRQATQDDGLPTSFGVTGEFASAEDAAAEAFREALAGMDSLRDPNRFGSWLRTIVVRKAVLGLQGRRPTAEALAHHLSDRNERPDDALERLELAALVQQGMRELPDRLREAMALVYFEGYDSDSAARFLDIPAGTLRRPLHDGRRRLRSAIERADRDVPSAPNDAGDRLASRGWREGAQGKSSRHSAAVFGSFRSSIRPESSRGLDSGRNSESVAGFPGVAAQCRRGGGAFPDLHE